MKNSDYIISAHKVVQDLFQYTIDKWDKNDWKIMMDFIANKKYELEVNWKSAKFIWRKVQQIVSTKYWNKFIK